MDSVDLANSVPEWVIEHPELLPLFRDLGIDYCCGGKSLEAASREQGLIPRIVLAQCETRLKELGRNNPPLRTTISVRSFAQGPTKCSVSHFFEWGTGLSHLPK